MMVLGCSSLCRDGNIFDEMIGILVQEKFSYQINLDFAYPALEPGTFEDNSNNDYKGGQYIYFEHPMNLSGGPTQNLTE